MNIEPLTPQDLRDFHDYGLELFGGSSGEHDSGMIDYTATKPFEFVPFTDPATEQYPGLYQKAAVYMHSLATHQYFVDGNKRTAYISAATFLEFNDYILFVSDEEMYYVSKLVSNSTSKVYNTGWDLKRLTSWIEKNVIPLKEHTDEMDEQRELRPTSPEVEREFEIMEMVLFIHEKIKEMRPSLKDVDTLELILSKATLSLFNKQSGGGLKLSSSLTGLIGNGSKLSNSLFGHNLNESLPFDSLIENIVFQHKLPSNINFIQQKLNEYKPDEDLKGIFDIINSIKPSKEQEYEKHIMLIEALTLQINICREKADYARAEELMAQQMELIKKLDNYNNE